MVEGWEGAIGGDGCGKEGGGMKREEDEKR